MEVFETITPGMPIAPVVGEVVAGEAAATLKAIKALVKDISTNTFDLGELLHKAKKNKYYQPKYDTFADYIKTLDIKVSKAYYLVKLVESMETAGISRAVYEPAGIGKLRVITRMELVNKEGSDILYNGVPVKLLAKDLVETASKYTLEDLELKVKTIQGLIGDNASGGWVNFPVTIAQRAKWEQALNLAKKLIGSVSQDLETGLYKDASIGAAAEVIAVSFIQDPNNMADKPLTNSISN